jgi:hypothetical protein
MKNFNRKIAFITACLFFVFFNTAFSQPVALSSMGEVSEIIIPHPAKMQKNNNLYYEVHLNRTDYPSPSFWYKIIFKEDCSFEFTLFPLMEEDGYDFYFFKVLENVDFCEAIKQEKLVSCNAARIYKEYNDKEQSDQFRSKLVNIKSIPVKAGDAIYIEVFSTVGNDCGHILDFRTTASSFVVKVINDKCIGNKNLDGVAFDSQYKPVFTEKEAIDIFSKTVCHLKFDPVIISTIKSNEKSVTILKKLDYAKYSASEAHKYVKPKGDSVKKDLAKKDSVKKPVELLTPKVVAIVDTHKVNVVVKSTADLNIIDENAAQIKHDIVPIKSEKEKNATRLDVDFVLFSLLKEDLKRKMESNREQLKDYNSMLKSKPNKEQKMEIQASIKEIKQQKGELLALTKDTKIKLKKIQKRLNEARKKPAEIGETVFAKSVYTDDENKKDAKTGVPVGSSTPSASIVYKIQIGVYKNPISTDVFKGLSPVFSEVFPGGVKYFAGAFTVYKDAKNAKEYIKGMGLIDAFVVAYSNGKRVSVEDARNHENEGK